MEFAFTISPPAKPISSNAAPHDETPCLQLTYFGPNIKLNFGNVVVGTTATQQVIIQNPSDHNIMISVMNLPPATKGVTLNWHDRLLQSEESAILEISWCPIEEETWRHTFKLEDKCRFKKSISVAFKSVKPKSRKENKRNDAIVVKKRSIVPHKRSIHFTDKENYNPNQNMTIKKSHTITFKDFSDDSLEVEAEPNRTFILTASPLLLKQNSTYTLTPDTARFAFPQSFDTPSNRSIHLFNKITEDISPEKIQTPLKRKSTSIFDVASPKRLQLVNPVLPTRSHKKWRKSRQPCKDVLNPYLLSVDPFLSPVEHNDDWFSQQEEQFKRWLNSLLTPPAELHSNTEVHVVDAAKLWQECKNNPVAIPANKEVMSFQYHTSNRLDSLRNSARNMLNSTEISDILDKVHKVIDLEKLAIRTDRNIHANVSLQYDVLKILLCYNPLWLRIGLETIYNTTIPLSSNSDIVGLTNFLMQRFFKDPTLLKKHKSGYTSTYIVAIKQFALKQFLSLVYFLDVAKTKVLISHDPCLFCKNAQYKASSEILFAFARELVAAVGDITRFLRRFGYIVVHQQKFIHEYDYSVIHLGSDLQDGVRLTKVMEIILVQKGLVDKLRVPAISKLQKIHNMEIVFTALAENDFKIVGDIYPKDVVEGHCEKTLSFIWQIIYKFQAPLLINAAVKIQKWWRSFPICFKRHILNKPHKAATKIQNYFKMCVQKWHFCKIKKSILVIQAYVRMLSLRRTFIQKRAAAITIQTFYRSYKVMIQTRYDFLKFKQTVIYVQRCFRRKRAAVVIQRRFRAQRIMRIVHAEYVSKKAAALCIQRQFRLRKEIKFVQIRKAAITIQQCFRANQLMKVQRQEFLLIKSATLCIQQWYRATLIMSNYRLLRFSVITVQRWFRAKRLHKQYCLLKYHTIIVQRRFRANKVMKINRAMFIALKVAVVNTQKRFRAHKSMQIQRANYLQLKGAAITIQKVFRATQLRNICYKEYNSLRASALTIQRRFRANKLMQNEVASFTTLKNATLLIQRKFKANKAMRLQHNRYKDLKHAACVIQQRFRAKQVAKVTYNNYHAMRNAAIVIQMRFRAMQAMRKDRLAFIRLQRVVLKLQTRFRENQLLQKAVILVQQQYRAKQAMRKCYNDYHRLKSAAIVIQSQFRAQRERHAFTTLKSCVLKVQQKFRARCAMRTACKNYIQLRCATIRIQQQFRANKQMRLCRSNFICMREASITIQRYYRALVLMKCEHDYFTSLKRVTIAMQQRFRANKAMHPEYIHYKKLQKAVTFVQERFRSKKLARIAFNKLTISTKAAIVIQRAFRRYTIVAVERKQFKSHCKLRKASAVKIQAFWRGYCARKLHPEMNKIRKTSKEVNKLALPQNRLGVRKEQAIYLLRSKNPDLLHIISALEDLDFITRRCKQTALALSALIPDILYLTVRSGNRSLPDMKACAAATGILINFYKYPPTSLAAWIPHHIENIFTNLLHCCDKEDKLFLYLSTIVWLFAHNEEYKRTICSIPNFALIMHKIQTLCLRKQKMVLQQRTNFSSLFLPYGKLYLPSLIPDWGLEYPERPRIFSNSIYALNCLIEILICK